MLVRSQNKKCLVDMNTITVQVSGMMVVCYDTSQVFDDTYICLGTYESEAKAIKVLDMIQKRYVDYQTTHTVANGLATMSLFVKESDDVDKMYTKAQNVLKETVVFQMPSDDEVEV